LADAETLTPEAAPVAAAAGAGAWRPEAVIFIGVPGSGKSTFYVRRFFATHVRLNLDMLRTRRRESLLLRACTESKQPFVADNTNLTPADRARYIAPAKEAGFRVIGYYFRSDARECLERNAAREGKARIPIPAIYGACKRLVLPSPAEGFDELYYVRIEAVHGFIVEGWRQEV
jgi:hypothetical protein